jgi:cell division protein FtsB
LYRDSRVPNEIRILKSRKKPAAPRRRAPGRTRRIVHLLLMFVAAIIVVDALVGDRGLLAILRARKEYDQLAATIAQERAENARLREEARRLREDPAAIEEIARRDLGLMRPGERVFIIKDVPQPAQSAPPAAPPPPSAPEATR